MNVAGLFELRQVVSALFGAAFALSGQWVVARARRAATARSLSIAFWEELSAAEFAYHGETSQHVPQYFTIGGFSSQTFDSLFHEMAVSLPDSLVRDLMRYHWRVKFLVDVHRDDDYMDAHADFYQEAKRLRENLLERLKVYGARRVTRLMLRSGE